MYRTLKSLTVALIIAAAALNTLRADNVYLTGIFVFSSDEEGNPAGNFVWDTRGLDSDFYKIFLSDGLAGRFLTGPTWAEAPVDLKLKNGENHFTIWFQANGTWSHFAMNLFFDDNTSPAISVKAPLTTSDTVPPFSANDAAVTYTMTSYPAPNGPASGTTSANLGRKVELTNFAILDPALLDLDRVGTHETGSNGATDFIGTFTLTVSQR